MGLNWKFFHMWLQHMFPTFSSTVTLFQIHMWLQHVSYLLFHCYSILDPHVAPACFLPSLPLLLYSRKTALFTYPDQFSVSLRCSHHHWSWSPSGSLYTLHPERVFWNQYESFQNCAYYPSVVPHHRHQWLSIWMCVAPP